MKAVFLMKDEETEDFCGRLVSAGGGKVTSYYGSIDDLLRHSSSALLPRMVTHIFLDDVNEWASSSKFRFLVKKTEDKGIKYLYYKSLLDIITGKDEYLPYWKIEDYFPIQAPHVERALKRTVQDSAGPSGIPYKAGRYEDIEEGNVGRKVNPERRVVVFNQEWVNTVD